MAVPVRQDTAAYMRTLKAELASADTLPAEEMAAFFGARLDIYDRVHLSHWPEEYARIADYFDEGTASLLDIGCGTGLELQSLFARFPALAVTGIDLSRPMLARLEAKYPGRNIRLVCDDYFRCPFGSGYDAALSFETLHHFPPADKERLFKKLFDALRPGGLYTECDYVACCDEEEALCRAHADRRRAAAGVPSGTFLHIDTPLTLAHETGLLTRAGFAVTVPYVREGTAVICARKPVL